MHIHGEIIMTRVAALLTAITIAFGTQAAAGACDYRPSEFIGGGGAGALATGGAGVAAAGAGAKAAGFYTMTHFITGATMLGSTAGGASAAGTVGIMGGTAGAVGTAGAILMAPATIVVGASAAVGVGGLETYCHFWVDERVTEYDEVLALLTGLSEKIDPEYFSVVIPTDEDSTAQNAFIQVPDKDGRPVRYDVENLYIVNGVLKHRDWFRDTVIPVGVLQKASAE